MTELSDCGYSSIFIMSEHLISVHRSVGMSRLDSIQAEVLQQDEDNEDFKKKDTNNEQNHEGFDDTNDEMVLSYPAAMKVFIIDDNGKWDRTCFVHARMV